MTSKNKRILGVIVIVLVIAGLYRTSKKSQNSVNAPELTEAPEKAAALTPAQDHKETLSELPQPHNTPEMAATSTLNDKNKAEPQIKLDETKVFTIRNNMKFSLAAMYVAQKAYFAEYNRFSTDFKDVGFSWPENQIADYKIGFMDSNMDQIINPNEISSLAKDINLQDLRSFCKYDCTIRSDGFEVITATNLDSDPDLEIWIINENKVMKQVFDDLAPRK